MVGTVGEGDIYVLAADYSGAKDPKALSLRFHVQTCGSTLTSAQPYNNVIRVALQALAAALGGAQSLHTNAFDEALALPSRESAQLALRTQQILAHETGVPDTVDPVGGAWALEALSSEIEGRVWETLGRVRAGGGMLRLIEAGVPQNEISERAYRYQQDIEAGRRRIVGVNTLVGEGQDEPAPKTHKISPALEKDQVGRLKAFRKKRDARAAGAATQRLRAAAEGRDNLFPYILASVEKGVTLGEICGVLRETFGEIHGG
jgi:methylmalonyl-CoA mutase N-terminal domain/subunit